MELFLSRLIRILANTPSCSFCPSVSPSCLRTRAELPPFISPRSTRRCHSGRTTSRANRPRRAPLGTRAQGIQPTVSATNPVWAARKLESINAAIVHRCETDDAVLRALLLVPRPHPRVAGSRPPKVRVSTRGERRVPAARAGRPRRGSAQRHANLEQAAIAEKPMRGHRATSTPLSSDLPTRCCR